MQVEWHEKHILLKVAFPLSAHSDKATFRNPYGSVDRPTNAETRPPNKAQFEVPASDGPIYLTPNMGSACSDDCKYGYDAKGNVLRLSLLRSPDFPDPHADEGHHELHTRSIPTMGLGGMPSRSAWV